MESYNKKYLTGKISKIDKELKYLHNFLPNGIVKDCLMDQMKLKKKFFNKQLTHFSMAFVYITFNLLCLYTSHLFYSIYVHIKIIQSLCANHIYSVVFVNTVFILLCLCIHQIYLIVFAHIKFIHFCLCT